MRKESLTLLLLFFGVFLFLSLYSYMTSSAVQETNGFPEIRPRNLMGPVGGFTAEVLVSLLGWCSFISVAWALLFARRVWTSGPVESQASLSATLISMIGSLIMVSAAASLVTILFGVQGGGLIGRASVELISPYVGTAGAMLCSVAVFFLSLGVATGMSAGKLFSVGDYLLRQAALLIVDGWFLCCKLIAAVTGASVRSVWAGWIGFLKALGLVGRALTAPFRRVRNEAEAKKRKSSRAAKLLDAPEEFELGEAIETTASRRRVAYAPAEDEEEEEEEYDEDEYEEDEYVEDDEEEDEDEFDDDEDDEDEEEEDDDELEADDSEEEEEEEAPRRIKVSRRQRAAETRASLRKLVKSRATKREKTPRGSKEGRGGDKSGERHFELPPLDLLVAGEANAAGSPDDKELLRNSERLEKTLADFRIGGKVVEVQPGPVITLYEFAPAAGVKVQRIISLADDLALALKVASVRVYAPVPGKGTVGIEVPNTYREVVRLRDVLASSEFVNAESSLTLAVGKDTFGDPYVADLARMPHLLIAGATGAGKSVCINSMILSLLYRNTPEQLRFIMIDPKMLELSLYEDIPHLKAPVVTNPKRARGVLWWAVEEMERRYRAMKELGVRNLEGYNRAVASMDGGRSANRRQSDPAKVIELEEKDVVATGALDPGLDRGTPTEGNGTRRVVAQQRVLQPLPRIVIIVDELADLMLTVGREVEELFTRLAQKARASGIHLVLATQRPSVNVITGLIKANFPARVSFKVASRIDSRTVLDASGAEKLLGQGDMLFLSPAYGRGKRLHSAFVSDKEVQDVVEMLKRQGPPDYDPEIESMIDRIEQAEKGGGPGEEGGDGEYDPLYDQAVSLVIEKGQASTSMVQRVFRIGYNRAARILEMMERDGVVGPADGAKPRSVFSAGRSLEE